MNALVDEGCRQPIIAKDSVPPGERQIGCNDQPLALIAVRNHLKQQFRRILVQRGEADLWIAYNKLGRKKGYGIIAKTRGIKIMAEKRIRRSYTEEQRQQLIALYNQGKPRIEIIRAYNLTGSAFDRCVKRMGLWQNRSHCRFLTSATAP